MKCDYCHEPGKQFTLIGPLATVKNVCPKCRGKAYALELDAERARRAKALFSTPSCDYAEMAVHVD